MVREIIRDATYILVWFSGVSGLRTDAAFRVKRTAVLLFTPEGEAEVMLLLLLFASCLSGVVATPPVLFLKPSDTEKVLTHGSHHLYRGKKNETNL